MGVPQSLVAVMCSAHISSDKLPSEIAGTSPRQPGEASLGLLSAVRHRPRWSLRSRARRRAASETGLDMIVVDYLQLLSFPRSESRQQEISSISRSLKELSRELEIPVVALAQLSRAVESRDPPRPQLADLRESGSIEQDADVVMMLYRPEYYAKYRNDENRGLAEVVIAKHRNGATGEVRLQFFPEHMRFENRAPSSVEQISIR
ncbi:MAG: DnaB-like helicase C-terminal domain-containing protein [Planctomycetota bacterium]